MGLGVRQKAETHQRRGTESHEERVLQILQTVLIVRYGGGVVLTTTECTNMNAYVALYLRKRDESMTNLELDSFFTLFSDDVLVAVVIVKR